MSARGTEHENTAEAGVSEITQKPAENVDSYRLSEKIPAHQLAELQSTIGDGSQLLYYDFTR